MAKLQKYTEEQIAAMKVLGINAEQVPAGVSGITKSQPTETKDKLLVRAVEFIKANQKLTGYKGAHSVYSGFNQLLAEEFDLEKSELFERLDALVAKHKLESMPSKGGYTYYLPGERPERKPRTAADIAKKLGI